ncbi:hypothetical protein AB833_07780 [Chromatiales bacterium (ex Bugula neritina AB1)]|nr:hypothetical protein AB833_07780 [Chromatiales bacterium (ex Bugula neritina AB1)]
MNFLAHVFFAYGEPAAMVGQLCGDFVRGSNLARFPAAIQNGIRLHRAIDSFTDRHPLNRQARDLFVAPHRRVAGIITDVAYDHFLAKQWDQHCSTGLSDYATMVSAALRQYEDVLPDNLKRFAPYLESEKILQRNIEKAQIDLTLQRISGRRKSMLPLATAAPQLWENEPRLNQIFDEFFPLLMQHVSTLHDDSAGSPASTVSDP